MSQMLIFHLGDEFYGLDIGRIREIVELPQMTPVPKAPNWVAGILNHHGRVVTVLNLSTFFDFPPGVGTALKKAAVLDFPSADIGILLEDPLEVISEWGIKSEGARDPDFIKSKYIGKVVISKERLINTLDAEKLVNDLDSYFI